MAISVAMSVFAHLIVPILHTATNQHSPVLQGADLGFARVS
jgi:hypothetical protein